MLCGLKCGTFLFFWWVKDLFSFLTLSQRRHLSVCHGSFIIFWWWIQGENTPVTFTEMVFMSRIMFKPATTDWKMSLPVTCCFKYPHTDNVLSFVIVCHFQDYLLSHMYSNAARDDLWSKLSQVTLTCPITCPRLARRLRGRAFRPVTGLCRDLDSPGLQAARLTEAVNYLTKRL